MKRLAIFLGLLVNCLSTQLPATPAQVILIPNAEQDVDGNLSQKGQERAGALAAYFALTPDLIAFGVPTSLFAARPAPNVPPYNLDDSTQCCIQTLAPTGLYLSLPIHSGYSKLQNSEIAAFILNNSFYDGKNIVICWRKDQMQALAEAFGVVAPPVYPVGQFDQTWVIQPGVSFTVLEQQLLFGDTP